LSHACGSVIGILPALGSGLTDLRRGGQHERLLAYDLHHYAAAYDTVLYFSYFDEALASFTPDRLLRERVVVLPKRGRWPSRVWAILLPLVYRREFRRCQVLRVMQLPGVIPAVVAHWLYGTPYVVTYGYRYGEVARIAGSRLKPWLYRLLERVAIPLAAGVIVTSRELGAHVATLGPSGRIIYSPNGVDPAVFAPSRSRVARDRKSVLYVGRLSQEKNLERLVDAMSRITPPARLVIIGEGQCRGALERRALGAGVEVEFRGVVPNGELPTHLRGADVFVLPSLTEGHPKALIEAMACALPCAASARGGIPSLLDDGVSGLLFDPEDAGDMAQAIGRLLTDVALARRLGERARAVAVGRYDAHVLLQEEVALVRSISGEAPTRPDAQCTKFPRA
jgi:glycosyltransferase involved in cell wall biosynthesis